MGQVRTYEETDRFINELLEYAKNNESRLIRTKMDVIADAVLSAKIKMDREKAKNK